MNVVYKTETDISADEFRQILIDSTLGKRRPVDDKERITAMIKNANLVVTARENGKLIGIARCMTDFVYATYLSDLAVHKDYQNLGIGKELIKQVKMASPQAKVILLSAPKAIGYYPKIGMAKHENCFFLDKIEDVK